MKPADLIPLLRTKDWRDVSYPNDEQDIRKRLRSDWLTLMRWDRHREDNDEDRTEAAA